MPKRIHVYYPTSSQYNVLHHFAVKLHEAFLHAGCHSLLLADLEIPAHLKTPYDFSITFNGAPRMTEDRWLADYIRKPHVALLVDPPFHYWRLRQSEYIYVGCDDLYGCTMLEDSGFPRVFFCPHAVEAEYHAEPDEKRPLDIALFATYIDIERLAGSWKEQFGNKAAKAMHEAVDEALVNCKTSFIPLLLKSLERHNSRDLEADVRQYIFESVELYLKGIERIELIKQLADFNPHVFGAGWEGRIKQAVIHKEADYAICLEEMKSCTLILNSSIKNRFGAHERVFTGTAAGSLVLTSENPFIKETFQDNLLTYRFGEWDNLREVVAYALSHPEERIKRVKKAQEIVRAHHTWDARVQTILEVLK